MRRAVLRGRSGDIVTAIRSADRTGIVAASAPPADSASPVARHLVLVDGEAVPELSARHLALIPLDEAGARRSVSGRARRRVLFTGAAVLCLALGWIGGETFGYRPVELTGPTVAVGVATEQGQPKATEQGQLRATDQGQSKASEQGPAPAPVATTEVPNPPVAVMPPPPEPRHKDTVGSARRNDAPRTSSTPSQASESRTPMLGTMARTDRDSMRAAFDQLQRFVSSWSSR